MSVQDDLLDSIFEGRDAPLYSDFAEWMQHSRRFRGFAAANRDKIRAKLRTVRDDSGRRDLRAELEAAALLLRDERFTLEYEKYAASKQRGPDFTVTYKTHTAFNVEVRRLRSADMGDADEYASTSRLMAVVCDKISQMPPSMVNLLWLAAEREPSAEDLARATQTLRHLAERKEEEYFVRRGFESAAAFLRHYRQLSGIVLLRTSEISLMFNGLARHKIPSGIANALQRLDMPVTSRVDNDHGLEPPRSDVQE